MSKFKNRMVGQGDVEVDQVLFNPENWRIHPRYQQEVLTGILEEIGWVQRVIINTTTGHLLDGHLRVKLAEREGEKTVPATFVELSLDEERTMLALYDPIGELHKRDDEQLEALLEGAKAEDARVQDALNGLKEETDKKTKGDSEPGEIKISPELYERHDYLVFYFDNEFDWQVACEKFGVERVQDDPCGNKTLKNWGLSRVLPGKMLI